MKVRPTTYKGDRVDTVGTFSTLLHPLAAFTPGSDFSTGAG